MYKVQTTTQRTIAGRPARLGLTVLGIATVFVTIFMMTQAIMTAVYGYELQASGSAYIGAGVAASAPDNSMGVAIDSYVLNIKQQVCPTLNSTAEQLECMDF